MYTLNNLSPKDLFSFVLPFPFFELKLLFSHCSTLFCCHENWCSLHICCLSMCKVISVILHGLFWLVLYCKTALISNSDVFFCNMALGITIWDGSLVAWSTILVQIEISPQFLDGILMRFGTNIEGHPENNDIGYTLTFLSSTTSAYIY